MRQVRLTFTDADFKKLENAKEEAKITHLAKNWEDYILKLACVR